MTTKIQYADIMSLAGRDLGFTDYLDITQERINTFADATDDHQYIHVDPERAKDGPFGTTVAHGFLTLSLSIPLWGQLLDIEGAGTKVNYGLDRVRFVSPVPVGSRIRMGAVIAEVTEVEGGYQLAVDETIEIEGGTKPAMVARALSRIYA
ncbi:MAG: putative enoyl-CoA hydratase 1 [Microbacteriaceae bacterium]|nr:putative enoyl-CoA hydratase 1 [Microbacteriaceae bacterium]